MTSRQRQRLETHEAVYLAALEEFFSEGVAAARIERIVERARVARGTFYFHFPTKDHVLFELIDRTEHLIADSIVLDDAAPLAEALRTIFEHMRGALQAVQGDVRRELISAQIRRQPQPGAPVSPLHARLAKAIERAQQHAAARAELDAVETARMLLASMFGVIALAPDDDTAATSLATLIEVALRGLVIAQADDAHHPHPSQTAG